MMKQSLKRERVYNPTKVCIDIYLRYIYAIKFVFTSKQQIMVDNAYFASRLLGLFTGNQDNHTHNHQLPQHHLRPPPPQHYSTEDLYTSNPPPRLETLNFQATDQRPSYVESPHEASFVVEDKTDNGEDISEDEKKLQKLPNAHRIQEIISKLKTFSIQKQLPNSLQYTLTDADKALESNIKALFADKVIMEEVQLEDILLIIVSKEDKLLSEIQNRRITKKKKFTEFQKNGIKKFYPCLVALIDAVLTRCDSDPPQTSENFHAVRVVLLLWKELISDLNELFKVIIYGKTQDMFDLGDFPISLSAIVNMKNKRISSITKAAGDEKREIIQLSEQLNQRDQKIKNVESEFANKVSEKKLKDAELLGLKKSLQSLTMVSQMVKINLGNIKAMSDA